MFPSAFSTFGGLALEPRGNRLLKSPHPSLGRQSYHPAKVHSLVPLELTLRSCHYASGVGQVQEDGREGWVQEVEVVKARRLSSWGVILARVTEKESEGDYISYMTPPGTGSRGEDSGQPHS